MCWEVVVEIDYRYELNENDIIRLCYKFIKCMVYGSTF